MKTMHWLLTAGALALAAPLALTPAFTQDAPAAKQDAPAANKEEAKPADSAAPKAEQTAATPAAKPRRAAAGGAAPGRFKIDPADGKIISPYSLAQRTAMNRQDCKPNNLHKDGLGMHGQYRTYTQWDPELKSIEGRAQFEACVKRGLEPTPWFAFGQRMAIASGGKFFGRGKEDCLKCHSKY